MTASGWIAAIYQWKRSRKKDNSAFRVAFYRGETPCEVTNMACCADYLCWITKRILLSGPCSAAVPHPSLSTCTHCFCGLLVQQSRFKLKHFKCWILVISIYFVNFTAQTMALVVNVTNMGMLEEGRSRPFRLHRATISQCRDWQECRSVLDLLRLAGAFSLPYVGHIFD